MTQHTRSITLHDPTSSRAIRLAVVVFAAALLMGLAVGCESPPEEEIPLATDEQVEQALRSSKLDAVPPEVAEMIDLDLGPSAAITDVDVKTTPEGIRYEVVYVENGDAKRAAYDRAGTRLPTEDAIGDEQPGPEYENPTAPDVVIEEPEEVDDRFLDGTGNRGNTPPPATRPTTRP